MNKRRINSNEFGIQPPESIWSKPKFNLLLIDQLQPNSVPQKKTKPVVNSATDTTPLIVYFGGDMEALPSHYFPEFNSGDFGGAGAGSFWGDAADGDSNGDASGDSSCSSCSSGCGGGD